MQRSKWIRIRPLQVSDFPFIRRLASKHHNFTVPPMYVLWLLQQTNARCCLVAEHKKFGPVAYLLSIFVNGRSDRILYVWQLAASQRGLRLGATEVLLVGLRSFVREKRVKKVSFTSVPGCADFRVIRRYAYSLFGAAVRSVQEVPYSVSRNERQFVVPVR